MWQKKTIMKKENNFNNRITNIVEGRNVKKVIEDSEIKTSVSPFAM